MFCNQCGSNIKDTANFCKYCGAKVKKSGTSTTAPTTSPTPTPSKLANVPTTPIPEPKEPNPYVEPPRIITKEVSMFNQPVMTESPTEDTSTNQEPALDITASDPVLQPKEDEKFDPITDDIIDVLYSREREIDIKEEIKENLSEVEKIEQRLNIGLASKDEASEQIAEKQNLMTALKAERKSLKIDKIQLEVLEADIKELKDKLDKLHIMYNQGKISHESVYTKLKTEYDDSLKEKEADFNQQKINITHWMKVLELDVQKMKEDIDMANTKADLGELPKAEAEKKQSELEIDIYRKELAYHALKKVQETLQK